MGLSPVGDEHDASPESSVRPGKWPASEPWLVMVVKEAMLDVLPP